MTDQSTADHLDGKSDQILCCHAHAGKVMHYDMKAGATPVAVSSLSTKEIEALIKKTGILSIAVAGCICNHSTRFDIVSVDEFEGHDGKMVRGGVGVCGTAGSIDLGYLYEAHDWVEVGMFGSEKLENLSHFAEDFADWLNELDGGGNEFIVFESMEDCTSWIREGHDRDKLWSRFLQETESKVKL